MLKQHPTLEELGWTPELEKEFTPFAVKNLIPARVAAEHRQAYAVICRHGEYLAEVSGVFDHSASAKADFPAVGDWIAINFKPDSERQLIQAILPRRSKISRKDACTREEQVIAANIDTTFIVQGLDGNYNLRRLERYITAVKAGGTKAVIILNKADKNPDPQARVREVLNLGFSGIPVLAIDSLSKAGYQEFTAHIKHGSTIVFIGSAGAGKSTIINNLLGTNAQRTREVRLSDSRGRHTTTGRKLFFLPGTGALLIDTPGMRGFDICGDEHALNSAFETIRLLAENCRFGNCTHAAEPGCAVREALERGDLDPAHLESYKKLKSGTSRSRVDVAEKYKRIEREKNSLKARAKNPRKPD